MTELFDFSQFPILQTERLVLRRLTHDDAEAMIAIFGSPEVLRFLNEDPVDTVEKAVGMIDWLNGHYDDQHAVQWGITLQGDDHVVGTCGFYRWDRSDRHVDIGYHIVPSLWGRGYATEAARAVVGWCFQNLGVHRIQADCTEGHTASERVMIKCGFKLEGTWRESCWEHGRFVNIRQYGLLQPEFAALSE